MTEAPGATRTGRFRGTLLSRRPLAECAPGGARHAGCRVHLRGYVANRDELAGLLAPPAGRDADDAELIALAYRRWGDALQTRVEGEYAVAVLDETHDVALLTHDRTAIVPVFYREDRDGLGFASHLADLAPDGGGALDEDYLADYLTTGFVETARTPYPDIRRLLPGESLTFERGRATVRRTWDLASVAPLEGASDTEYEERLRETLGRVIGPAALGGRAWGELSGGLDSSTVVAFAAPAGITALSVVYPTMPDANEELWMRDVVEMHDLAWERLEGDRALPFAAPPDTAFSEPTVAVIDVAANRQQDELLASHGVELLLTGAGGDAVLRADGPPQHLADPLFRLHPVRTARELARWRSSRPPRRSWLYWATRHALQPAYDHLLGRTPREIPNRGLPSWIRSEYERDRRLRRRARRRKATRAPTPGQQAHWDQIWTMSMAAGVAGQRETPHEVRRPLLQAPLVELMFSVPWEQKLRPDCDRYLQRRALRGVLPETVRRRATKTAFSQPVLEGLRRNRDWVELLTDSPRLAEHGIVELETWRETVAQARFGRTHTDKHFLAAVSLEVWLQQRLSAPSAASESGSRPAR